MGWWQVDADTLAGARFLVSPLAEALAALKTLHRPAAAHPGQRRWLEEHLGAYRARLAADPQAAALVPAALGGGWNATFLTPVPGESLGFEGELAAVRATSPDVARADLAYCLRGPLPPALAHGDLAGCAARLLEWVWEETVAPDWARRRRVLEADVLARAARSAQGGWAAALEGTRPGLRWLGGERLQITTGDAGERQLAGARLVFVPVTFQQTWLCWDDPRPSRGPCGYGVVYPCAGVLAEAPVESAAPLAALLGPGRAAVLARLAEPKSTTQLVALTGLPLGSVGRHLRVLREARLVGRRREGRVVLYFPTTVGRALLDAQG
ncbi:ArsR/SmtB family transcription factor [Streptomyces sp. NRRL WC-3742]|uniref:ArsR/SmtB family transcription factor n=1 Tax=Streptomyces sp. NRRL WC-3742 TaxID=1463934 RepID=UPI0004C88754|nr:winged helix-turn-helix domain-containing protein [Streptomyces sp. NRRL WC-3742]